MRKQIFTTFFGLLAFSLTAIAQPAASTEPIDLLIAQNQPLELVYPNVFDTIHAKELHLSGTLAGPTPGTLAIFFDWIDLAGLRQVSPVQEFQFFPGAANQVDMSFTLPFCPSQVSVDFRLGDAPLVEFAGEFTHTCLDHDVPDAGPGALD